MSRKKITFQDIYLREKAYKRIRFLITLVLLALGALFIYHSELRLAEYEKAQPSTFASEYVSALEGAEKSVLDAFPDTVIMENPRMTQRSYLENRMRGQEISYYVHVQVNPEYVDCDILAGSEKIAAARFDKSAADENHHYGSWDFGKITPVIREAHILTDLADVFEKGDFSAIVNGADISAFITDTREQLADHLSSFAKGKKITVVQIETDDEAAPVYQYLADGEPMASLSLLKKEANGLTQWEIGNVTIDCANPTVYTVRAPSTASVFTSGKALDASFITESGIVHEYAAHLPQDIVNPVDLTECVYSVSACFSVPEFTVYDAKGRALSLTSDGNSFSAARLSDQEDYPDIEKRIFEATDMIGNFVVSLRKLNQTLGFIEKDSAAYDILHEYAQWPSVNAGSAKTLDFRVNSITTLGDNCFAADVYALFYAAYSSHNKVEHEMNYTYYFHLVNDKWMIYDFVNE